MTLQPFAVAGSTASGALSPAAMGIPISSIAPLGVGNSVTVPAQAFVTFLCTADSSVTLTVMGTYLHTAGVTAGAGVNRLGIYSAAGVLLSQTADMTAAFTAGNLAEGALLTPVPVNAGTNYYLAILPNFTGTQIQTIGFAGQAINNGQPLFGGVFPNLFAAGQAVMPASFTPSGLGAGGSVNYVYGR